MQDTESPTPQIESGAVSHPKVAEGAVSASRIRVLGEKIVAFVILRDGAAKFEELRKEISTHVRKVQGPVSYPDTGLLREGCPQKPCPARSCAVPLWPGPWGLETGDISALANPESIENIPRIDL